MILGMFAQYGFKHFSQPFSNRQNFDWGVFISPILVSPLIFLPLLAALQNSINNLETSTAPRYMMFLVSFQNGFFWKDFFDNYRKGSKNDQ